ncbi:MAG: transcriptional repressor LexA, partial [Clostridia bacterium]
RHCGFSNIGTVYRYIKVLTDRGLLEKDDKGGIDIDMALSSLGKTQNVSLVGTVACGQPLLAIENIEGNYQLPTELIGTGEAFMLRAKGASMQNVGIQNGDILIVRRQNSAEPGEIVIALIDDEATAKKYYPSGDGILFKAENDDVDESGKRKYDVFVEAGRQCEILGVVIANVHKFE